MERTAGRCWRNTVAGKKYLRRKTKAREGLPTGGHTAIASPAKEATPAREQRSIWRRMIGLGRKS